MVKIKLQLFAKKVTDDIVNAVIRGNYGNGQARKTALANAGYDYNEVQSAVNAKLNGNSSATSTISTNKSNTNVASTNDVTTTNPTFDGVDQQYVDITQQEYKPSEKEEKYLANRDQYGQNMIDKMNAGPQFSESVNQAFQWLEGQQEYFKNGRTSWDDKIFGQIDAIENREDFVYDVDKDQLFQQALASAMSSGKTAMQDTIGQASALTGGYSSTFATSAGNQAYNDFIQDAYDNLPAYYQMAMEAYQMEGQEMYDLLGMYVQMGEQEWNRNVDAYNTVFNYANSQREFEYGMYQDDITNTYNAVSMYDSFYQAENEKNMKLWQQEIDNAWKIIGQQSTDYWNQKSYDQTEYWNQKDLDYKKDTLAEQKRQFNLSIGDTNNDGIVSEEEKAAQYSGYINPDDVEVDENGNIVKIEGYNISGSNATTPTTNGFRTTKGDNFDVVIGDKSYRVENKGKVTDGTVKDKLNNATSYGDIRIYDGDAYIKSGNEYYKLGDLNGFLNIGISNNSGYGDLLNALGK